MNPLLYIGIGLVAGLLYYIKGRLDFYWERKPPPEDDSPQHGSGQSHEYTHQAVEAAQESMRRMLAYPSEPPVAKVPLALKMEAGKPVPPTPPREPATAPLEAIDLYGRRRNVIVDESGREICTNEW